MGGAEWPGDKSSKVPLRRQCAAALPLLLGRAANTNPLWNVAAPLLMCAVPRSREGDVLTSDVA